MIYVLYLTAHGCPIAHSEATSAPHACARSSRKPLGCEHVVVIAISGLHGTGKTTLARMLARKFNLRYVCAGIVFRQLARERGMTLNEFSRYVERHPVIDRQIDRRTADAAKGGNVLIDARLAGWMAKRADVRILLTAPLEVRVRRMAKRDRRNYKEVLEETLKRERSEAKRFKRLYGIDVNDHSPFDLVFNTTHLSARENAKVLELPIELITRQRAK